MQHLQPNTTLQGGKYRIERVLGQGGFGITYIATNTVFDDQVAIKEFFMQGINDRDGDTESVSVSLERNLQQFDEQREKFKKEALRIRKLNNPHIIKVHDLFEEKGTVYYVMDFVDGENLAERLKRTGAPLDETEVQNILPQVLDALRTVHDAGIWHLDLKPANILIDKTGNIKIIDFGASKQFNTQKGGATTSTAISYTNGYAPREQMEQNYDKFGPWTDFYALGATLYTLLTNKRPPLPTDIDDDISEDKHLALPMPNVSDKMKQLILWLMKTNRTQRPKGLDVLKDLLLDQETSSFAKGLQISSLDDENTIITDKGRASPFHLQPQLYNSTRSEDVKKVFISSSEHKYNWIPYLLVAILFLSVIIVMLNRNRSDGDGKDNKSVEAVQREDIIKNLLNNMVNVEGGIFTMGGMSEQDSDADDKPMHQVSLSSFSIGKYEVTQEEWMAVMGSNPSYFNGVKRPVENVSWNDCQEFIQKINAITGKTFRLPTEAEWEFAARGGISSRGYTYSGSNYIGQVAWYGDNSSDTTHEVGKKLPNELGLYDMTGNVAEWCQDWFAFYSSSFNVDPTGPSSGMYRVIRGGSWSIFAMRGLVTFRHNDEPWEKNFRLGLRLAL